MSDTYTKLFRSIAASTIVSEPLATRWLWVTLLSQADRAGCVYGSIPGLARMANITLEEVEDSLRRLESPDAYSRTKDHEGRRLEPFDGGWRLLNHAKYAAIRDETERAEYKRSWDRNNRSVSRNPTKSDNPTKTDAPDPTSTSTSTSNEKPKQAADAAPSAASKPDDCPHQVIVDLYHERLPTLSRVKEWTDARRHQLRSRWREDAKRQTPEYWARFFDHVAASDFLMGRASPKPGGKAFAADLEWLTKSGNFVKVIEGKYHDAGK